MGFVIAWGFSNGFQGRALCLLLSRNQGWRIFLVEIQRCDGWKTLVSLCCPGFAQKQGQVRCWEPWRSCSVTCGWRRSHNGAWGHGWKEGTAGEGAEEGCGSGTATKAQIIRSPQTMSANLRLCWDFWGWGASITARFESKNGSSPFPEALRSSKATYLAPAAF